MGDIMSWSPRQTCSVLPPGFTPSQRILLTANGNVQRILSSYYNTSVTVDIIKNQKIKETIKEIQYDRQVELWCMDKVQDAC